MKAGTGPGTRGEGRASLAARAAPLARPAPPNAGLADRPPPGPAARSTPHTPALLLPIFSQYAGNIGKYREISGKLGKYREMSGNIGPPTERPLQALADTWPAAGEKILGQIGTDASFQVRSGRLVRSVSIGKYRKISGNIGKTWGDDIAKKIGKSRDEFSHFPEGPGWPGWASYNFCDQT